MTICTHVTREDVLSALKTGNTPRQIWAAIRFHRHYCQDPQLWELASVPEHA